MIGPLSGMGWNTRVEIPNEAPRTGREAMTFMNAVTPGWFATYGIRTDRRPRRRARRRPGRRWPWQTRRSPGRFFGAASPIGRRVGIETGPGAMAELEIVGLVADAAYRGVREEFQPTLFRPLSPDVQPPPFTNLTVRTAPGGAQGLQPALTRAIRGVDPTLSVSYQSMANRMRDQLTEVRTIALLSGFFGVLALLLAAIGLYGVTSYSVNERRREIGIRLTLGAGRAAAERFVLGRVARLVGIGVALGLAASLALSPMVKTMLYELQPRDPATIALAAVVLAIVGLLAGWLPARRAARIDPAQVLERRLAARGQPRDEVDGGGTPPCRRSSFAHCARCPWACMQAWTRACATEHEPPGISAFSRTRARSSSVAASSQASARACVPASSIDERVERLARTGLVRRGQTGAPGWRAPRTGRRSGRGGAGPGARRRLTPRRSLARPPATPRSRVPCARPGSRSMASMLGCDAAQWTP